MSEPQGAYIAALGSPDKRARKAAFTRAHQIRQFEIELYWKRANYFWLLQAAVFTAFGLMWKEADARIWGLVPVSLACLGVLTSLAGWLASQGSKFWQSNWEFHIDMLEDEFEGRLHKTALMDSLGVRWSVSGINDRLSLCFVVFWLFVAASAVFRTIGDRPVAWGISLVNIDEGRTLLLALILATAGAASFLVARLSRLRGEVIALAPAEDPPVLQRFPRFWKPRDGVASIVKRAGRS